MKLKLRAPVVEAPAEVIAPTEPVAEAAQEQPTVEAPLQAFEVTEQAPIETTLEKVLEEPAIETVSMVEEAHIPAHPLEAPQQAHSEVAAAEQQRPNPPSRRKRRKHN